MKVKIIFILIILSRIVDLYTTKLAIDDFLLQEQNLIVKLFKLEMKTFLLFELLLAFLLGFCYLYYKKNESLFKIGEPHFFSYITLFFFSRRQIKLSDGLFKIKLSRVLVLFGGVIPIYVIVTSLLFSINNYWVYWYQEKNQRAIKYYHLFAEFYFFDFIIFVFPPLFLFYLLYRKLKLEYLNNKALSLS